MYTFIHKKIFSLQIFAELNFSLQLTRNPYLYIISKEFGKEAKQINSEIIKFTKVVEKEFDEDLLLCYYMNIDCLNIIKVDKLYNNIINACYDPLSNVIEIKRRTKYTIYHELFHMAARNGLDTGFEKDLGTDKQHNRGLNEGYTDLMTHRYFGDLENDKAGYQIEMTMARMVEEIVGKDLMEKFYLKCDPNSLEACLTEYMGIKAYSMLDLLDDVERMTKNDVYSEYRIQKKIKQIYIYILEGYIKKQYIQYKNNEIDIPTVLKNIDDFTKRYGNTIEYDNVDYNIYTDKILTKVLNNNLYNIEKKIG